jgi:hypothetical protein
MTENTSTALMMGGRVELAVQLMETLYLLLYREGTLS